MSEVITMELPEKFRAQSQNHLIEYENSVFLTLLKKGVKERGSAYESICCHILNKLGWDIKEAPEFCGSYDLIVNGQKIELKCSRKGSPYDTRKRTYQFNAIRLDRDIDGIFLMVIEPNDIVKIFFTNGDELKPYLRNYNVTGEGDVVDYTLLGHPEKYNLYKIAEVQFQ